MVEAVIVKLSPVSLSSGYLDSDIDLKMTSVLF